MLEFLPTHLFLISEDSNAYACWIIVILIIVVVAITIGAPNIKAIKAIGFYLNGAFRFKVIH
jgi:uncharacterized membrane protein YciS (DUF1049 family)